MNVIYPRCCGLDVHQKTVTACVQVCREDGKKHKEVRTFGTWTQDLQRLADWLSEQGVTHVAMEATGVYWKPVWAVLAGQFELLLVNAQTIPELTAWNVAAEIGVNMDQFPSPQQLASWAGLCPGNNESAGKRRSGQTRYGAPWLKRALCQAAWAAAHTRNTYFSAQYRRLAARRGKKRAIIAVAHSLLIVIYCIRKQNRTYQELGGNHFDQVGYLLDSGNRYMLWRSVRKCDSCGSRLGRT